MPVEIISEIGCNTNGDLRTAFALVDVAQSAGADFVKFQTWFRNDWPDLEHLKFSKDVWRDLFLYCELRQMPWFATPFDLEAIAFLKECGMKIWKVPSGMLVNRPYLEAIREAAGNDRIIVSTGMATHDEINLASVKVGTEHLYCVSLYPALPSEIDLSKMDEYSGFSDHSEGDELAIAAVDIIRQRMAFK